MGYTLGMRLLAIIATLLIAWSAGEFFAPASMVLAVVVGVGVAAVGLLGIGTVMVILGGPEAKPAKRFGEF
jgi:ABC-type anion transport system duplicated permease subunit